MSLQGLFVTPLKSVVPDGFIQLGAWSLSENIMKHLSKLSIVYKSSDLFSLFNLDNGNGLAYDNPSFP